MGTAVCYYGIKEVKNVEKRDNYAIQANQARERFLTYDQHALQRKLGLRMDENYLYTTLFSIRYRINRITGRIEKTLGGDWKDANSFAETLTLFDLICDSREDRRISGRWKNMQSLGQQFHRNLLEGTHDPDAEFFARDPEGLAAACRALGGVPLPQGDVGYAIEVFDGLLIGIQLWLGDEEFPSALKFMWDENALQYLRYETTFYARGLLLRFLREQMNNHTMK